MIEARHLSAVEVAAFIDRTLTADDRARAESHLASCDKCCVEVAECVRMTTTFTSQPVRARRVRWAGWAAAAVLMVVVVLPFARPRPTQLGQERSGRSSNTIRVVTPAANEAIQRADLRFVWRRDAGSTGYRVILKDAGGTVVWDVPASDTSAAFPASVVLAPEGRYFWRVDALHDDGTTRKSTETPFRVISAK